MRRIHDTCYLVIPFFVLERPIALTNMYLYNLSSSSIVLASRPSYSSVIPRIPHPSHVPTLSQCPRFYCFAGRVCYCAAVEGMRPTQCDGHHTPTLLPVDSSRYCSGYLTAECDFTVGLPVLTPNPYRSMSSDKLRARCQFLHRMKCQSHYVGKYVACFSIQSLSFLPSFVL